MALKEKNVEKKSRLLQVLKTEYRWENLFLGIVAIFGSAVSLMIITKTITISSSIPVLGSGSNGTIFASVLLALCILCIFLVAFPYFFAAFPEIKKISWSHGSKYFDYAVRTFIFIIIFALTLFLYDFVTTQIIKEITGKIKQW